MPEEIKKVIVFSSLFVLPPEFCRKMLEEGGAAFTHFLQKGSWSRPRFAPSKPEIAAPTLLTGASPKIHRVEMPGAQCHAEYIWEAALRSSKKTVAWGLHLDRMPSEEKLPADLSSVAPFLRTSPAWDLCFLNVAKESSNPQVLGEILSAADEETLCGLVFASSSGAEGFFGLAGPGVKKGFQLSRELRLEDVVPTICYLGEISIPSGCEGGIIYQALEDPDMKIKELRSCRRNYERLRRSSGPSAMC